MKYINVILKYPNGEIIQTDFVPCTKDNLHQLNTIDERFGIIKLYGFIVKLK